MRKLTLKAVEAADEAAPGASLFADALGMIYKAIEKDMFVRFKKQADQMNEVMEELFKEARGSRAIARARAES